MSSTIENSLREYLEAKASLHRLKQDMVLFYANQKPMTAVWLKRGVIQTNFHKKTPTDIRKAGLYYMDELLNEIDVPHSAKVLANSEFWLLTRTELQALLALT
ncbi:MAG: hypothetical protein K2P81_02480 [Bacteriovoracaceae bacterium]|nr:hypothetical protein [Bacteriovoracaceae bacterium]